MNKIASPNQLTQELRDLVTYCGSNQPSRDVVASKLRELADRVGTNSTITAGGPRPRSLGKWKHDAEETEKLLGSLSFQIAKMEHEGTVTADEAQEVFGLVTEAQKSLGGAIQAIDRI